VPLTQYDDLVCQFAVSYNRVTWPKFRKLPAMQLAMKWSYC